MADAKPEAKPVPFVPQELEAKAAVQKFQGRPKRVPVDQAEYFYNVRSTHILSFVCSLLMLVSFLLMFRKDDKRPWKPYQQQFADMDFEKLWFDMNELETRVKGDQEKIKALDDRIEEFLSLFRGAGRELAADLYGKDLPSPPGVVHVTADDAKKKLVVAEKEQVRGEHYDKMQKFNFAKDELGSVRYRFEEAKHHYEDALKAGSARLGFYEKHYNDAQKDWDRVNKEVTDRKADFDAVDKKNSFYEDFGATLESKQIPGIWDKPGQKPLNDLRKERAQIVKDLEEKELRFEREKPSLANKIRNAPGTDFFDPTLKVRQQILPDLKDQLNFTKVEKVDRCHTCHVGIANPTYAVSINPEAEDEADKYTFKNDFLKKFVAHARAIGEKKDCSVCDEQGRQGKEIKAPLTPHGAWQKDDAIKFTKAFMAHPRLDLFVGGASKHPLDKVGCTVCHEGDGRDTDFTRVVHTPDTKKEGQDWRRRHGTPFGDERYDWSYRELWDLPMFPTKYAQASCRRCHTDAVELDGAEKYVQGMKLVERAGCYGCHRVDSYQILPKDVNDLKVDVNRKNRRPGPPLTRIAAKVTEEWAAKWVISPREFRPTTRMPHFFKLSNTREQVNGHPYPPMEEGGVRRSPVDDTIAASIVKYLWSLSDTKPDPAPPGLKGDAHRGELLVRQVGCSACHKVEETPVAEYEKQKKSRFLEEFAPTLAGVGSKMNKEWLYAWVKNPKKHFPDSLMPNLRLAEQEAVDVVEYLMTLRKPDWEKVAPPVVNQAIVKDLCLELLRKAMPHQDAERVVKGEFVGSSEERDYREFATDDGRVRWLGRKMVKNFGCYSCHLLKTEEDPAVAIDWKNEEGIGVELTGSQPFGSKHHDRLDFGFAAYDGVNHHGVTFKHGFTGDATPETSAVKVHETRHDWLEAKLKNPRLFDGGKMASKPWDELLRMPWFDFTDHEIDLLTTFVLSFTDHGVAGLIENGKKRPNPDEIAKNRGDRIVRESNCRSCHRISLDKFEVEWTRKDPVKKGKMITSWTEVEGKLLKKWPLEESENTFKQWGLQPRTKQEVYTIAWVSDQSVLAHSGAVNTENLFVAFDGVEWWYLDIDSAGKRITRPIRRHVEMEGGEILPALRAYKLKLNESEKDGEFMDPDNVSEFETRYPPMLRTQGVKTQADWLFRFLKAPHPIRPPLQPIYPGAKSLPDINLRMPTFEFTDEEASSVVRWFAVRDHLKGVDVYPHTDFPERGETFLSERKGKIEKVAPVVRSDTAGCASCHYVEGKAPPGGVLKHAPDLAKVGERLRPRWLYEWQSDPAAIYPGTTMTQFDFRPLFPNEAAPQKEGVKVAVELLLNFEKFNVNGSEPKK